MSESALLTHTNEWLNAGVDSITLYLSVLFAYFVAAHLVGQTLTRTQFWIVAVIYSAVVASGLVAIHAQFTAIGAFFAKLDEMGSEFVPPVPENTALIVPTMYACAFVASHVYMHHCRRPA